ncbi:MAG: family 10 glycosylhydrolase [Candidatus Sumerlaeia bacterium]
MTQHFLMRISIAMCLIMPLSLFPAGGPAADTPPPVPREFRAVWVATVANIDWPSEPGLPSDRQIAEMKAILDKCVELKFNAVVFQVRPACDALYASELEPWSPYLSGTWGKPPEPYYDPLAVWCEEAHKRGIELHAWINPYRARHSGNKQPVPDNHISKTNPKIVRQFGNWMWLDPSEPGTRDHTMAVVLDIVRRYDVDGIHMDDYFYPYDSYLKEGGLNDFPDEENWQAYKASGGTMSRSDWRRNAVDQFIERFYKEVKATKPWVKVGISPFGIWRPGYPEGITGLDQYNSLYADCRKWLNEGWVDYFTPQLYWPIGAKGQSYPKLLNWWCEQNLKGRHVWPGNAAHSIGNKVQGVDFTAQELIDQIKVTRAQPGATGNVFFSMKHFMNNRGGICDLLKKEVYQTPALVPASPWLQPQPPARPTLLVEPGRNSGESIVSWNARKGDQVASYVYYFRQKDQWFMKIIPAESNTGIRMVLKNEDKPDRIAVSAVDRFGNESERAMAVLAAIGADQ